MTHPPDEKILRYRPGQRLVHAVLATSFLLLLLTGLAILWRPLTIFDFGPVSRYLHRLGAIGFILVPLLYLVIDWPGAKELIKESFTYDRDDWEWLKNSRKYFFGQAEGMPPQGRLNAGQKIHHAGVIITSFFVVASGLVMWLGRGPLNQDWLAVTVIIHDLSMLLLTVLLVGHLYFTFVYDALSGMTTGYIDRAAAELEHPKWVEELERKTG